MNRSSGDRGCLGTVTEELISSSEEEVGSSETAAVCIVKAVPINFEFISETGGA